MSLKLNKDSWLSIAKGAAIAGSATALTYISQSLTGADFGSSTGVVVGILSVLINYLRKALTENAEGKETLP